MLTAVNDAQDSRFLALTAADLPKVRESLLIAAWRQNPSYRTARSLLTSGTGSRHTPIRHMAAGLALDLIEAHVDAKDVAA